MTLPAISSGRAVIDCHIAGGCLAADDDERTVAAPGAIATTQPSALTKKRSVEGLLWTTRQWRQRCRCTRSEFALGIKRLADLKIELRLELIDRDVGLRRLAGAVGA
ncbi:MAG: hypothetical protein ACLS3C_11705 [Oscillospiraceae bacterium]